MAKIHIAIGDGRKIRHIETTSNKSRVHKYGTAITSPGFVSFTTTVKNGHITTCQRQYAKC